MTFTATPADTIETFIGEQPARPAFIDWTDETETVDTVNGEDTIETFIGKQPARIPSDY